ncbi:MAG: hypothetical protein EXR53_01825 [Dehalococcoidia bacterium]|nr:hypothetical protein [Dehalococcoidia bacterium]
MAWAIGLALAVLCLWAVGHPLLRKRSGGLSAYTDPISELAQQRQAIYQEARTLHNDYVLGDVLLADYQKRLQEYRLQAARLLYRQERLQELDQRLEAEIQSRRSAGGPNLEAQRCHECGSSTTDSMKQCSSCGALLSGAAKDG